MVIQDKEQNYRKQDKRWKFEEVPEVRFDDPLFSNRRLGFQDSRLTLGLVEGACTLGGVDWILEQHRGHGPDPRVHWMATKVFAVCQAWLTSPLRS